MSRPIRIEFAGALYHVTARGDRREDIYDDDQDRQLFLTILADVTNQFSWVCHAWCLMDNHYHLLIETPDANLSKGMRQLNGVYTQASNRRHGRVGHLFQGRFKAILVDSDSYLLELTRYVVLNPVRAKMVKLPGDWPWSSYRASVGLAPAYPWMATDGLLAQFGQQREVAQKRYVEFVISGIQAASPWSQLTGQVYLGDAQFVQRMQAQRESSKSDIQIPRVQRRPPPPALTEIAEKSRNRDEAIVAAYRTGGYSYQAIADYFGLHFTTVGKIVRRVR